MMRMLLILALVLGGVLGGAASALAQPSPIHLAVDTPYKNPIEPRPIEVPFGAFYIGGWTLNCYTGMQAATLAVFDTTVENGQYVTREVKDAVISWRIERPDVLAATPWICNAWLIPQVKLPASAYLGFHIYFPTPLSKGAHHLVVRALDPIVMPMSSPDVGAKYWQANIVVR